MHIYTHVQTHQVIPAGSDLKRLCAVAETARNCTQKLTDCGTAQASVDVLKFRMEETSYSACYGGSKSCNFSKCVMQAKDALTTKDPAVICPALSKTSTCFDALTECGSIQIGVNAAALVLRQTSSGYATKCKEYDVNLPTATEGGAKKSATVTETAGASSPSLSRAVAVALLLPCMASLF